MSRCRRRLQAFRCVHRRADVGSVPSSAVSRGTSTDSQCALFSPPLERRRSRCISPGARTSPLWMTMERTRKPNGCKGFPGLHTPAMTGRSSRDTRSVATRRAPTHDAMRLHTTNCDDATERVENPGTGCQKISQIFSRQRPSRGSAKGSRRRIGRQTNSFHHPPPHEPTDGMMSLIGDSAETSMRRHPPREV